jgi:2-methylisocitrate lyase-like PEP mutase family enzyme
MPRSPLRPLLARGRCLVAPGVFDLISTHVLNQHPVDATYVTGFGLVASSLGLPDAGLATYTEMIERIERIAEFSRAPVIADADTGYGGLLNVRRTVRGYEKAGVAAIQLEDQEFPKKCGHTPGRRVIPMQDMVRKLQVAKEARSGDMLIVARTDARTTLGLDEALRRADAYLGAGADVLFVESPETEAEMAKIASSFDVPMLINVVEGGRTPVLAPKVLEEMGFALAIYPAAGFLAAGWALEQSYAHIKATRSSIGAKAPLADFMEFSRMMGFEAVWAFDRRHAEE